LHEEGNRTTLDVLLRDSVVTPHSTGKALLTATLFIHGDLKYPLQWNALYAFLSSFSSAPFSTTKAGRSCNPLHHRYAWHFDVQLSAAKIFFLMGHLNEFSDLSADWSSYAKDKSLTPCDGLEYFYPCTYTCKIMLSRYEVLLNVNENNVIDDLNNMDTNTHIRVSGPELTVAVRMPYLDFNQTASHITYDVTMRNAKVDLVLPRAHPLADLLGGPDQQFMLCNGIKLHGSYRAHYQYNVQYRDSHTIDIDMDTVETLFHGHFVRYFLAFKDNYFSSYSSHMTSHEFEAQGRSNRKSLSRAVQRFDLAPELPNVYETFLSIAARNMTFYLPQHLFKPSSELFGNARQPTAKCHEIQLQVRSVPLYMDFTMTVSPTVIYVPSAWSPEAEKARAKADFSHHWNDCETYVRINDVSYNFHTSTGDVPLCTTFRASEIAQVGTVTAQLFPAQVLSLVTCFSNFSEQYTDAVDHTLPAAAPPPSIDDLGRKTDSAAVDDLKFETKQEIKLPDLSKEFAVGAIRLNLLHTAGFSTDVDTPLLARSSAASRGAASTLSMTRVDVPRGLQLHSSSLITSESMQTTVLKLPSLELSHLRPLEAPQLRPHSKDNALDGLRWVCLAKVEVTGVTSISTEQRTDMESLFKLQQSFIYSHMVRDQADHDDQYSWHELNARRVRMDQPEAFEGDMGAYGPDAMRSAALYRKPSSKSLYADVEGVRKRLPRSFSATSDGLAFISDGDEEEGVSKSESESRDTSDSGSDGDDDEIGANASDGALLGPELVRCLDSFKLEEFSHTLALKNKNLRTDARSKSPYLADVKMGGTSTGTTTRHYPHTLFFS
jgi:hypothetical protein